MKLGRGIVTLAAVVAVAGPACGSSKGKAPDAGATPDAHDSGVDVAQLDTGVDVAQLDTRADVAQADTGADVAQADAVADGADATGDGGVPAVDAVNRLDGLGCDVGADAFCAGVRIALFGNSGVNPASDFAAYLTSNGQVVSRIQTTQTPTVTVALLSAYDVVILDRLVRSYTAEESQALRDWVAAGGALMSMTGYTGSGEDRDRPNTLLAAFGLQYVGNIVSGPVTMFVSHPTNQGLASVTFSGGYLITTIAAVTGGVNTVTATLAGGTAAEAQERGAGRVFVWGDEWVEFDSEWQGMPMIRQFWVETLGWLEHLR